MNEVLLSSEALQVANILIPSSGEGRSLPVLCLQPSLLQRYESEGKKPHPTAILP
jgi:hypothetical protein